MEQQGNYTSSRVELQDLSTFNLNDCGNAIQRIHNGQGGVINVNLTDGCNISMSNEESKIHAEKDLEGEIKDGICHLALQLHRFYQHQRDRNASESSKSGTKTRSAFDKKLISEVKITIKMEGGSKIEINEIKKLAQENPRPQTSSPEGKQGKVFTGTKKFNWVDTLRSGNSPAAIVNKKHEISHGTARVVKNVYDVHPNIKLDMKERRNWNSALTDRKKLANWKL